MLKSRIITAIVLLAIFIGAIVWLPNPYFALLTLAAMSAGGAEWARLVGITGRMSAYAYGAGIFVLGLLFCLYMPTLPPASYFQFVDSLMTLMLFFWFLLVPLMLFSGSHIHFPMTLKVSGFLVLLSAWVAMVWLKEISLVWFVLPFLIVWLSDTVAFFVGRHFGRHKLAPTISPGKTREGAIGALIIVCVAGTIAFYYAYDYLVGAGAIAFWQVPVALLVLAIMGIIGDLFESSLKRKANVKDSGVLLPGHGGILDRIDALLPVLPIIAWISYKVVWPMNLVGLTSWSF